MQQDVNRRSAGREILLDENCRITKGDGAGTFEIATGKKTYYLTADSVATVDEWVRVLQVSSKSQLEIGMSKMTWSTKKYWRKWNSGIGIDASNHPTERCEKKCRQAGAQYGRPETDPSRLVDQSEEWPCQALLVCPDRKNVFDVQVFFGCRKSSTVGLVFRCGRLIFADDGIHFILQANLQASTGQINMKDARVKDVDHKSDSDNEDKDDNSIGDFNDSLTIEILPSHQSPIYLHFSSKQDKVNWVASDFYDHRV